MSGFVIDAYAGPGGWDVAAARLGLHQVVGIEWDAAACLTRAAAGHSTIRADVSRFPLDGLPAGIAGFCASPPCTAFSNAGKRAGVAVTGVLSRGIQETFAGRRTRAARRREMAACLRAAWWPSPKLTRAARSAKIWHAVRDAAQVLEPARFIAACSPEWVALEQVPAVLPLWQVYAEELRKRGYSAWCGKLNSANYGVPQTRERAILIASRIHAVRRPEPTHYDPRKGMQLWGTPWVSMATALGWGATERPAPTATAGGVAQGGYEPFAKGGREALTREQEAGRWALRKVRGAGMLERGGRRRDHPPDEPAPTITAGNAGSGPRLHWVLQGPYRDSPGDRTRPRTMDEPATTVAFGHSSIAPAQDHAGVAEGDGTAWKFRNNNNACERSCDEPAGTLFFGHRSNWAAWVAEGQDSIRISVEEAAALQSFPPGYPWRGSKTKQYEQCGNAFPPLLAEHVLAMATGTTRAEVAA